LHANLYGRLLGNRNDADLPADTGRPLRSKQVVARILSLSRQLIEPCESRFELSTCQT
jgi:hypothetical protein